MHSEFAAPTRRATRSVSARLQRRVTIACTAAVMIVALGTTLGAKPKQKTNEAAANTTYDTQESYLRYLELARATAGDPNAPRWLDSLTADPRARSLNDLLTVRLVENLNATGTADSSVTKNSSGSAGIPTLLGLEKKLPGLADPTSLASTTSDTKFKGGGTTTRTGQLTANMTVRVAEVLPNGYLALEGAREIQINGDKQVIVLTGVVRPTDIAPGNVILSTSIGQLRVQYVGSGLMKDSLSPGWLIRLLNKVF